MEETVFTSTNVNLFCVHVILTFHHVISILEYEIVLIASHRSRRDIDSSKELPRFRAFSRDFQLSLHPSHDVVAPQLTVMRSKPGGIWTKQLYTPEGRFLQGHVTDDPHSHVAVRELGAQHLSGAIISGGHEYRIEPVPHHVRTQMSLDGPSHHVITRRSLKSKSHSDPIRMHAEPSWDGQSRWRRSAAGDEKIIEGMITVDKPTTDYYGSLSMDYALAIANMANRLFSGSSIGIRCTFTLTKLFLIESDLPALDITSNAIDSASKYLRVFSTWYTTVNTPAGSVEHFDNAVLLTREICGLNSCVLDGLAYYNIPCQYHFAASVNDAYGMSTAFSVVHEMAHNFGVDHDSGACSNGYIMSAGQATGANAFKWSSCSRDEIKRIFSDVTCYNNRPPTNITLPSLPPGYTFDQDKQCKFAYGNDYRLCPRTTNNCGTLFCIKDSSCVSTRGMPPIDGSPCGNRMWCVSGHCVDVGDSLPPNVDGGWGAWGEHGGCSRTCGGGVRHRTRKCDNPKPQFGGKSCPGSDKGEWVICNTQECPAGSADYRETQCKDISSSYSTYYISGHRCVRWCRTGSSATREGYVADGTKYDESDTEIRDIKYYVISVLFQYVYIDDRGNLGYTIKYFAPGQANQTSFVRKTVFTSKCSKTCAGGLRSQVVTCHREDDNSTVSSKHCGTRPPDEIACNQQPCPEEWQPKEWSRCSKECGSGTRTRRVPCVQLVKQASTIEVDDRLCNASIKPVTSSLCNAVDCGPGWFITKWTACIGVPGGPGVAVRTVECHNLMANGSNLIVDDDECIAISAAIPASKKNCTVEEEVPGKPHGISYVFDGEIYSVTWTTPRQPNGVILGYKVYFELTKPNKEVPDVVIETEGPVPRVNVPLTRFHGDKTYMVQVAGRTSKGYGDKSDDSKIIETPVTAPPVPELPSSTPDISESTADIEIPEFSDINGAVKYYLVVNTVYPSNWKRGEMDPENMTTVDLVTYCEAHKSSSPAAYLAFKFSADDYEKYEKFTLGGGEGTKCGMKRRSLDDLQYYNGPLRLNVEYKPFVRGYTSESEYSQATYDSFKLKDNPYVSSRTDGASHSVAGIVVGCIVGLVLIVVIVLLVVWRRRRMPRFKDESENTGDELNVLNSVA